jgi:hypothetical protein
MKLGTCPGGAAPTLGAPLSRSIARDMLTTICRSCVAPLSVVPRAALGLLHLAALLPPVPQEPDDRLLCVLDDAMSSAVLAEGDGDTFGWCFVERRPRSPPDAHG